MELLDERKENVIHFHKIGVKNAKLLEKVCICSASKPSQHFQ